MAHMAASAAQVTFRVDMSAQVALGLFDPAADLVFVAGNPLNGWSTSASQLAESETSPGIWTGTFEIGAAAGTTVSYKFVISKTDGVVWEGNVGPGGGTGNRTFTLAATDQTLPVVFFNNVSNTTSVTANITFQVNMSVQTALGNFDPDSGAVSVAGEFNSWSTSAFVLERSATEPDIWTGTISVTGAVDSSLSYKFVLNGSGWEGNVGENGAQNRSFILTKGDQTLPLTYFNNVSSVPTTIPVTFEVNLAVQIALGSFDPVLDAVSVAGDFNNWDTAAALMARSDTETNVWVATLDITGTDGAALLYKFVLNGATWEGINNRTYTLTGTEAQTTPRVNFNDAGNLGPLSMTAVSGGRTTLTWTAGPLIRLQKTADLSGGSWENVAGTEGQSSATVDVLPGRSFFRLEGP